MELKHLRAFIVLAEELHFGRAAQRLSIVQPALSMQIKALEEELGVRLFDRDRHAVALSEVGRIFLPEARAALHQSARAVDIAKASGRGEIGRIRIAFVSSVLPNVLPTLIRTLHVRFPRIEFELKDLPTPDQLAGLRNGLFDFGLVRLPILGAGIRTQVVLRESFVVALPADHALAARAALQPADLAEAPLFLLARRYAPGFYNELVAALDRHAVALQIAAELGEFTTMLALVSAGLGVGLLPSEAALALPPKVVARPLELGGHRAAIGLAWTELDTPIKNTVFGLLQELFPDRPL
ncbi:DNA-binding transcriptional regulator, LysR family [Azotobacter beijerinckii]|uniref:DNA-binding transcriptional regulator, LysR family n=1 Tax=Azotobacter beijerinckii TaxID=170623 RepID=A0A1H9HYL5_9GAMM|nr:LysR substrate-binding domain-containing protein [Azotobacter beijerinckii]SEI48315.1 DNA-binding transcriptional regulator, LysR family [Azotobacter beijerinckii]SEI86379.1 DNA-binding transcriptional regulator, LysR family [Azotobacter beijerinckii]SEQ67441.1 DNA-binding transcriptional regulator, LysR family [Azotobacter beijerinckii]